MTEHSQRDEDVFRAAEQAIGGQSGVYRSIGLIAELAGSVAQAPSDRFEVSFAQSPVLYRVTMEVPLVEGLTR
jgi:hypothetical protein